MKLPIKLICLTKRVHEDGISTVSIQYCYNAQPKMLLHTGIKIPPTYWKAKQCCIINKLPVEFWAHDALDKELRRQARIAEDLVPHAVQTKIQDKGAFVKKTFSPSLEVTTVEDVANEAAKKEAKGKKIQSGYLLAI